MQILKTIEKKFSSLKLKNATPFFSFQPEWITMGGTSGVPYINFIEVSPTLCQTKTRVMDGSRDNRAPDQTGT